MSARTPRKTALAYMAAWNEMDAAACAACFAEDGVREGRILARATAGGARFPRFVGRPAIQERIAGFMVAGACTPTLPCFSKQRIHPREVNGPECWKRRV